MTIRTAPTGGTRVRTIQDDIRTFEPIPAELAACGLLVRASMNGSRKATAARSWAPRTSPQIVLAEDEVEFRTLLSEELRKDGFDVVELADGAQLLEHVNAAVQSASGRQCPSLIISDLVMPKLSGLFALHLLRQGGHRIPVIVITGFGTAEVHAAVMDLGAIASFNKPFDIREFRATVRRIVTATSSLAPV